MTDTERAESKERKVQAYLRMVEQHGADKVLRLLLEIIEQERALTLAVSAQARGEIAE